MGRTSYRVRLVIVFQPPLGTFCVLDVAPGGVWPLMTRLTSEGGFEFSATHVIVMTSPTLAWLGPVMVTLDAATGGREDGKG